RKNVSILEAILAAVFGAVASVIASRIDRGLERRREASAELRAVTGVLLDEMEANVQLVERLLSQEELVTPRQVRTGVSDLAWRHQQSELRRLDAQVADTVAAAYRELVDFVRRLEHL